MTDSKWARSSALAFALVLAMTGNVKGDQYKDATTAYERGDYATALRLFGTLAEQGNVDAQFNLAVIYASGTGEEKNHVEAFKWFSIAAAAGDQASRRHRDQLVSQMSENAIAEARKMVREWHRMNK